MDVKTAKEYLQRRISPGETHDDLLSFPRFIEIETVNACNARCPMCTIDEWTRKTPIIKDALFDKLAGELIENADLVTRVSLYRDGEPLLDKKLADRVARLKEGGIRETAISTNVSLLDERRARDLLEAGLGLIILSIDSLKKDVFEAIRLRLTFEEVLENALRFIELRDRINPGTKISVRMIRQESNLDEWDDYHAFWAPKLKPGHDRVYFHNIFNWGNQLNGFSPIASSLEPRLPCVALWSLMVIFANGEVPLCNVDFNDKYPTGSVAEKSIAEVWQSEVLNERRRLHLTGNKAKISLCDNCNVWDEPPGPGNVSSRYVDQVDAVALATT